MTMCRRRRGRRRSSCRIFVGTATAALGTLLLSAADAEHTTRVRGRPSVNFHVSDLIARSINAVRQASLHSHVLVSKCLPETDNDNICMASTAVKTRKRQGRPRRYNNSGSYYGIREDLMLHFLDNDQANRNPTNPLRGHQQQQQGKDGTTGGSGIPRLRGTDAKSRLPGDISAKRKPIRRNSATLTEIMGETLLELREMREEIFALREEMKTMKQKMWTAENGDDIVYEFGDEDGEDSAEEEAETIHLPEHHEHPQQHGIGGLMARRKKHRKWEKIGHDIEKWADNLFFKETCELDEDGKGNGWKEVKCARVVRQKYNKHGRFTCYMKWMPDSREENASDDAKHISRESPCICLKGIIDAPFDHVCDYLSRKEYMHEYNELVCAHRDLEEITPHSKITWAQVPQILFVKPRDFVTYCQHRWKRDGTLVIVNQACEHEDAPGVDTDKGGKVCRAYALRGANYISRDSDDRTKTRFCLLAHADPGGGLPQWACKSAVNAVAPIEPFKLFHNIEECVQRRGDPPPRTGGLAAALPGRSSRPAGVSQMGYACFWPGGGGLLDKDKKDHKGGDGMGKHDDEADSSVSALDGNDTDDLLNAKALEYN